MQPPVVKYCLFITKQYWVLWYTRELMCKSPFHIIKYPNNLKFFQYNFRIFLRMDFIDIIIQKFGAAHEDRLHHNVNVEAIQLLDSTDLIRRRKKTKAF